MIVMLLAARRLPCVSKAAQQWQSLVFACGPLILLYCRLCSLQQWSAAEYVILVYNIQGVVD